MILQQALPYDVYAPRPLPGIAPLGKEPWLSVDEAYAEQQAYRTQLLQQSRERVIATNNPDPDAMSEMLDEIVAHLPKGFSQDERGITCPDRRVVSVDRTDPFGTLGQIIQEDVCLLEKRGKEHVLTGAVLCFPASWRLS